VMHRPDVRLRELVPFIAPRGASPQMRVVRRPRVVIHPGGALHRRWPVAHYTAIAQRLIQQRGASIAIIGGAPERPLGAALEADILRLCPGSQVENWCGCSLNETVRVVSEAILYVGNNAGPMQIAVAVGTPVVGVFLQLDRHFSGPDAAGDEHGVVARERLEDISVDDVWDAIAPRWRDARVS
jgi:ADP-heptose:LPS heptosyltransferase